VVLHQQRQQQHQQQPHHQPLKQRKANAWDSSRWAGLAAGRLRTHTRTHAPTCQLTNAGRSATAASITRHQRRCRRCREPRRTHCSGRRSLWSPGRQRPRTRQHMRGCVRVCAAGGVAGACRMFLAGGAAGAVARTATAPLDRIKLLFQVAALCVCVCLCVRVPVRPSWAGAAAATHHGAQVVVVCCCYCCCCVCVCVSLMPALPLPLLLLLRAQVQAVASSGTSATAYTGVGQAAAKIMRCACVCVCVCVCVCRRQCFATCTRACCDGSVTGDHHVSRTVTAAHVAPRHSRLTRHTCHTHVSQRRGVSGVLEGQWGQHHPHLSLLCSTAGGERLVQTAACRCVLRAWRQAQLAERGACVCVCERERARARARVCVCVCVRPQRVHATASCVCALLWWGV
jgi:hypothetical protein